MKNAQLFYWSIVLSFLFGFYLKSPLSENQLITPSTLTPPQLELGKDSAYIRTILAYSRKNAPVLLGKSSHQNTIAITSDWFNEFLGRKNFCRLDSVEQLGTDGLQLFFGGQIDPPPDLFPKFLDHQLLSIFILNAATEPKVLMRYSGALNLAVEAQNRSGEWEPIAGSRNLYDHISHFQLKILPGEFAFSLVSIPTGDFSTQIRLRLVNGDNIIVSRSFDFNLDYSAFQIFEAQL